MVKVRSELLVCLFLGVLVCSLFYSSFVQAASYPDLSVVGVAPYNTDVAGKYISGYRVVVANYGSAASPETTMEFRVRTYDGKSLNKTWKVPSIAPGHAKGLRFSMCNQTDCSFKNGYVVINKNKAFRELKYSNNARNFGLKETMLRSANKTVTETYEKAGSSTWTGDVTSYDSPASTLASVSHIKCTINDFSGAFMTQFSYISAHIPSDLRDNTIFSWSYVDWDGVTHEGSSKATDDWGDYLICSVNAGDAQCLNYVSIEINGTDLESKDAFNEPITVYTRTPWGGSNIASDRIRHVEEGCGGGGPVLVSKTYVGTDVSSYLVRNQNVTSLKITGDPRKYYVAGWFIQPRGNVSSVNALYGSGSCSASYATAGYWGVRHCCVGLNSIGFEINGTNLQGFSNFRSFGFSPWTWKEQY